jgi:cysteinyl-tRNA synthetase
MALVVHNTLTKKKEKFVPLEEGKVKLYLCGPTVYDYLHIGNFRGPITFNLMRNWMEHIGYDVTFVYNYTDVDDKIINRAKDEGVESIEISERFIAEFEKDFNNLGLRKHDHNPKVTEYIPQIIDFVKSLVDQEKAYVIDGEVFYDISTFKTYGELSGKNLDENVAGQRVEVDARKKNPADFVLWKPAKEGEPSWESPWGAGRPGWHIECSAMIRSILGDQIDIHGGGIDLIFPHHENEIAQSEGCTCKKFCNYWIHNDFINMGDQKMSKSLGNIMTGRNFMETYSPEVLKYLFLSAHYRSVMSITDDKITQSISALTRIYSALKLAKDTLAQVEGEGQADSGFNKKLEGFDSKIKKALNDDFNTAIFISQVFEGVRAFNALGFGNKKKRNAVHKGASESFLAWMHKYGEMSALFDEDPDKMLNELEEILIRVHKVDTVKVDELLAARNKARDEKDWATADSVRDELNALGVEVLDGSTRGWRVKIHD